MSSGAAAHMDVRFNWCEVCVAHPGISPAEHFDHEAAAVHVGGVTSPNLPDSAVTVQANYLDGDREPLLWINAYSVTLTPAATDELIAVLQEQRKIMASVQPTPAPAGMVTA